MEQTLCVNNREFTIIKLLGKGKGGYSYLATDGRKNYVLKQMVENTRVFAVCGGA